MRSIKTDFVFYLVISIALTLLCYLVYNSLEKIDNARHIIKVFSTLALPVPLSILFVFIMAGSPTVIKEYTRKDIFLSMAVFTGLIFITIFGLYEYNQFAGVPFQNKKLSPIFINSLLMYAYINNYLRTKNIYLSGILSGILLGLALFIFMY